MFYNVLSRSRIGIAKQIFMNRKKVLTDRMNLHVKKQTVKYLVWRAALYAVDEDNVRHRHQKDRGI